MSQTIVIMNFIHFIEFNFTQRNFNFSISHHFSIVSSVITCSLLELQICVPSYATLGSSKDRKTNILYSSISSLLMQETGVHPRVHFRYYHGKATSLSLHSSLSRYELRITSESLLFRVTVCGGQGFFLSTVSPPLDHDLPRLVTIIRCHYGSLPAFLLRPAQFNDTVTGHSRACSKI